MTTIEDTLTYIDGSKANGRLVVGWKPFTVGNVNAAGGELEWQIVEGAVSISLYSNTGAQPTGSYYVVKYELENGAVYLEQWIVPDLPTVNLGQVRVAFPPSPSVMISPLQLTSLGAAPGMFLMWNGQRWVPGYPGTFSFVDPTLVKGDMIVRGDVAPATRLGVGLDGWTLIADSSQALGIKWVAPVSGFADPTTTKGDLIVRGGSGTTRIGAGTNSWVLTADSSLALGIKWAAVPLSPQTPWTSDIDGANHMLYNASKIGIGTTNPQVQFQVGISPNFVGAEARTDGFAIGGLAAGNAARIGGFYTGNPIPGAAVHFAAQGSGQQGAISLLTKNVNDDATQPLPRLTITTSGNCGIGTTNPSSTLDVNGAIVAVSMSAGSVTAIAVSPLLRIWETTGNNTLSMSIDSGGYVYWKKWDNATILMLNTLSGKFAFGAQLDPLSLVTVIAPTNPGTLATATQIGIGETTNNPTYRMSIGFGAVPSWSGVIQATAGTPAAGLLLLQPAGGNVAIRRTDASYPLDVSGDVNASQYRINGVGAATLSGRYDLTGGRSINGVYQNANARPIFVTIYAIIGAATYMRLLTDAGNPPTSAVAAWSNVAGGATTAGGSVSGWVMPGHWYKAESPSATLQTWFEYL